MATTTPATRAVDRGGLSFMQKLSPSVFLLRPSADKVVPAVKTDNPTLILILGWMNAGSGPLAKYVRQYEALFPSSTILLVTCSFANMTVPFLGLREARIAAITTRSILGQDDNASQRSTSESKKPRLLIHAFSNGGSTMLYHLYTAFATTDKSASSFTAATAAGANQSKSTAVLPLHATVLDSTPAPFSYQTLVKGILDGTPGAAARLVVMPIAYFYVALIWFVINILRVPDHIGDLGPRAHNDPSLVQETNRVYIYGPADRITPTKAIESHADDAEAKGFRVRREVFEGSGHVAHARKHGDRYWRVVAQNWEEAQTVDR